MSNEELVKRIQGGIRGGKEIQAALLELWNQNQGMLKKIVRQFSGMEEPEDLLQEAFFGVVRAAESFDPGAGATAATWICHHVKATLLRHVDNWGRKSPCRIPVHALEDVRKLRKVVHRYELKTGREPSEQELCRELDISPEALKRIRATEMILSAASLDAPVSTEDGEITMQELLPDPTADTEADVLGSVENQELASVLWPLCDSLDDSGAFRLRWKDGKSAAEIAEATGSSPEAIRASLQKTMKKIREPRNKRMLQRFLPEEAEATAYHGGLQSFQHTGLSSTERAALKCLDRRSCRRS